MSEENIMSYPIFDRSKIKLKSLSNRKHDLQFLSIKELNTNKKDIDLKFDEISKRIISAKYNKSSIVLMMGGHVIRSGTQKYIIDLMRRRYISCIAMNGAGMIHDFEFALIGATTENVSKYLHERQFGLWKQTGYINDFINDGYKNNRGMGESVGKSILEGDFSYKDISILASGYQLKIPITVHVGIGYDIIHEHLNCDGAATGATSYKDFLYFTKVIENLEGGVLMNFGSQVMSPEVFLKALSMVRNTENNVKHFSTLVCDIQDLPENYHQEPSEDNPAYYFRPWKTQLVRTVADGGESFYVKGRHEDTIPSLWRRINDNQS